LNSVLLQAGDSTKVSYSITNRSSKHVLDVLQSHVLSTTSDVTFSL